MISEFYRQANYEEAMNKAYKDHHRILDKLCTQEQLDPRFREKLFKETDNEETL